LLLDLKDLQSLLQFVGESADELTMKYGNVSKATIGAIQRGLLQLEQQGAAQFFGEPAVKLDDFMQTLSGKGVLNLLAADDLINSPKLYSTFLLWLLSELFETLPEAGDLDKPKLVFFFDEAHLLFNDAPTSLVEKIEQVVRLIRSKGVGVYFVTQSPADIPDKVLAQLGNRIQHALRAYTPTEQQAVSVAAKSFRENPALDTVKTITEARSRGGIDLNARCEGRTDCSRSRIRRSAGQSDRPDHIRRPCAAYEYIDCRRTV
jgi:DNA helicase HerA-like ATPase